MSRAWVAATILFAMMVCGARAIDRNARSIETVSVETANFRDLDYIGLRLDVEKLLAAENDKWALLAAISGGKYDPDGGRNIYSGSLSIGVRHYLFPVTAISVTGSYRTDDRDAFRVVGGTVGLRQRFRSASKAISPWVEGRLSIHDVTLSGNFLGSRDQTYSSVATAVEFGCDFMMNEHFAFVFSAGGSETSPVQSGKAYADGIFAAFGMRYYWQ